MSTTHRIHPHDVGLPEPIIRKRRRSRRLGIIMLTIAVFTAIAGWFLFGTSLFNSIHIQDQPASLAIFAYGFLVVSGATLVLGFWYLLLTQVERLARIVDAAELEELTSPAASLNCVKCHQAMDAAHRFCPHCGAPTTGS